MAYTAEQKREYSRQKKEDHRTEWLATIEQGIMNNDVPWRKPWKGGAYSGLPKNIKSKKAYRGSNTITLMLDAMFNGYSDMRWGTRKQLIEKGLSIKGLTSDTGTHIVFFKRSTYTKKNDDGEDETKASYVSRWYEVWNVEQCDDYEAPKVDDTPVEAVPESEMMALFHTYVDSQDSLTLKRAGGRAFYRQSGDLIQLPKHDDFTTSLGEVMTAFHEAGHSTGHGTRLGRSLGNGFGSTAYAFEELIAEMASMFVTLTLGGDFDPTLVQEEHANSLSYLKNWLDACQDSGKAISLAFHQAQEAADYILDTLAEVEA
jgi:antirestriction protein ArdC